MREMIASRVRMATGIGIALLGMTILLGGLLWVMRTLPLYRQEPADLLPAERTVALLEDATPEEFERFARWFPVLATLSTTTEHQTVAVLALPDGTLGTARFFRSDAPESTLPRFGPFRVEASSPAVENLLQTVDRPQALSSTEAFKALRTFQYPDHAFVYARLPALTETVLEEHILQTMFLDSRTHVAWAAQSGGTIVALAGGEGLPLSGGLDTYPSLGGSALCMAHAAEHWEELLSDIDAQSSLVLEGIAGGIIEQLAGQDTSLRYDILPLLSRQGCLVRLPATTTGSVHIAIGGIAENPVMLSGALTRLHTSFAAGRSSAELRERTFEGTDFTSRTLREVDDTTIETITKRPDGWTIRLQEGVRDTSVFLSAYRENSVVIGNDTEAVELLLHRTSDSSPVRLVRGIVWATGRVAPSDMERMRAGIFSPLLPVSSTSVGFEVERRSDMDIFFFTSMKTKDADVLKELDSTE